MKEYSIIEKMLVIILFPVLVIITGILYITRGQRLTNNSAYNFCFEFINVFRSDIYEFLSIDNTPSLNVSDEVSSKLGEFRNVTSGSTSSFLDSIFNSEFGKTFHSSILINYNSIGKRYLYNSFITKLVMVNTIVHELTHYAQYVQDRWEPNHSPSFKEYRKEPCEVEARQKARLFVLKHFIQIVKFIIN